MSEGERMKSGVEVWINKDIIILSADEIVMNFEQVGLFQSYLQNLGHNRLSNN